ncbi:MAG: hypothetical protein FWC20_10360 [Oscillospiraceae bacterium]|nr:hypothetical protein [Oscillospiraceae bacterium]MCL2279790.1 hypothetical protein [Oscillospiraceae bacterium]
MQITKQDNQIKFDRISHAYIADEALVGLLAMAVVCSARDSKRPCHKCVHCDKALRGIHPDIMAISRPEDKRDILVDQIRELRKDVYVLPCEASQKAYIIHDAETMNHNAQNALLQVLEEPPAHMVFILCTNNPAMLLSTIRSRCVILTFQNVAEHSGHSSFEEDDESEIILAQQFISALGYDDAALVRCMFQIEKLNRTALSDFLSAAREQIVFLFKKDPEYMGKSTLGGNGQMQSLLATAEQLLTKAEEMLRSNVSSGHIAGMVCAGLLGSDYLRKGA